MVVDFWAAWCGPCRQLTPVLEAAVERRDGAVVLAKVDIDSNPGLAQANRVMSIPLVKGYRDGDAVAEFVGLQPPPAIEAFLDRLVPSEADRLVAAGDEDSLRAAVAAEPGHVGARVALARLLLDEGRRGGDARAAGAGRLRPARRRAPGARPPGRRGPARRRRRPRRPRSRPDRAWRSATWSTPSRVADPQLRDDLRADDARRLRRSSASTTRSRCASAAGWRRRSTEHRRRPSGEQAGDAGPLLGPRRARLLAPRGPAQPRAGAALAPVPGRRLPVGPDDHVLDVATGTGAVAAELVLAHRCRVTGLDQSADMLAAAAARLDELGLSQRVDLVRGRGRGAALRRRELRRAHRELPPALRGRPGRHPARAGPGGPPRRDARRAWSSACRRCAPARAAWRLYTGALLPAAGLAMGGRPWWRAGRFLHESIPDFYRRHPLPALLDLYRGAGLDAVRVRRLSLGGGVVIWGTVASPRS